MTIKALEYDFSVVKLKDLSDVDLKKEFTFVANTDEEISLVVKTENVSTNVSNREDGYKAFRIEGELDFSLVGILAGITSALAENKIPVFAVSTYNTDYIFVKAENLGRATEALKSKGYSVV